MSHPAPRISPFEQIRHTDDDGEYWSARELAKLLDYTKWNNFVDVIQKARLACETSGHQPSDHFAESGKMIPIGKGGTRRVTDWQLSRYACYLIVQNGDPAKKMVAMGQTYFAAQTRRAEILSDLSEMSVAQQRIVLCDQLTEAHGHLAQTLDEIGLDDEDFSPFYGHGWVGLYAISYRALQRRRGIPSDETPINYMTPQESVPNLMRVQQTDAKIVRENITDADAAGQAHFQVGRIIRRALQEMGAPMPEDMPKEEHIDIVRRKEARRQQIEAEDRLGLWALSPSDEEDPA